MFSLLRQVTLWLYLPFTLWNHDISASLILSKQLILLLLIIRHLASLLLILKHHSFRFSSLITTHQSQVWCLHFSPVRSWWCKFTKIFQQLTLLFSHYFPLNFTHHDFSWPSWKLPPNQMRFSHYKLFMGSPSSTSRMDSLSVVNQKHLVLSQSPCPLPHLHWYKFVIYKPPLW